MDEDFEVRRCDGPGDRGEVILVMDDRYRPVQRMLPCVTDVSIDEWCFLMDPRVVGYGNNPRCIWGRWCRGPECAVDGEVASAIQATPVGLGDKWRGP